MSAAVAHAQKQPPLVGGGGNGFAQQLPNALLCEEEDVEVWFFVCANFDCMCVRGAVGAAAPGRGTPRFSSV